MIWIILFGICLCFAAVQALRRHWKNAVIWTLCGLLCLQWTVFEGKRHARSVTEVAERTSLLRLKKKVEAQSSVTGIIVDAVGAPIAGVRCGVSGFPLPSGGRQIYTGAQVFLFSDKDGRFSIPNPREYPLVDLQFDGGGYAPVFLYGVSSADSPLRVVMPEGKLLRGRVVERINDKMAPIPHALIELQMPQDDSWYLNRQATDENGEFQFRISEPPGESPWLLNYAGRRLPVDYDQITPDTVVILEVSVAIREVPYK